MRNAKQKCSSEHISRSRQILGLASKRGDMRFLVMVPDKRSVWTVGQHAIRYHLLELGKRCRRGLLARHSHRLWRIAK